MAEGSKVRVYMACSLDGFIAGKEDDLSWLAPDPAARGETDEGAVQFEEFMSQVGAMLMGRGTYDVVAGFPGDWPYGETPVLVATSRELEGAAPTVRGVSGSIEELVSEAAETAGDRDVYLDGGGLIRAALDAGLVDELVVTVVPKALGEGVPLFAGVARRHDFEFTGHHSLEGMVQLHMRPRR
jgi:dihydrofolate reductase